jgi:predicted HAD superfamily phosphohydrolase
VHAWGTIKEWVQVQSKRIRREDEGVENSGITVIAPIEIVAVVRILDVNVRMGNEQAFEVVSVWFSNTRAVFSI